MIKLDWKSLNAVGQEYLDRLLDYAQDHQKSFLNCQFLEVIGVSTFRNLILCPPAQLDSFPCPKGLNKEVVYKVYDSFFQDEGRDKENNAVWLTRKLNIKVCPYCNRTYTFTIKGMKGVRPELDHFYPRSNDKYMHLAISFYNLVPSCPSCNKKKHDQLFDFHPYLGPLNRTAPMPTFRINDSKVQYDAFNNPVLFPNNPEIQIVNPNKNTSGLAMAELYHHHSDYAKEILDKIIAYNASSYVPLVNEFQGMGRTPEEIDRLIWGNYIDDAHQIDRPLSKLTYDILKQFGII